MKVLVLCGGSGTRLWPVSRELFPKQFIELPNGKSLLQNTYTRILDLPNVSEIITVTNQNYFFFTQDEYQALAPNKMNTYFLEPFGRNTAAPVALAALYVLAQGKDEELLVLPSDHLISDVDVFKDKITQAFSAVLENNIVVFGIEPTAPKTGYGYIRAGDAHMPGIFNVKQFVEKPNRERATEFLAQGNYFWNAGMFFFKASVIIEAFKEYAPLLWQKVEHIWTHMHKEKIVEQDCYAIPADMFQSVENISLDYAILEHAKNRMVVPMDCQWSDVGSWAEFKELYPPDAVGNRTAAGDNILLDVKNSFIQSKDKMVVAIGVEDLMIIDTKDALLIAQHERAEDVKHVVNQLKANQHDSYKLHPAVKRPWGEYTVLEEGQNYKIKRIVVKPKASLSLQYHHHRSEHWVVVEGCAQVINGESEIILETSQSTFISKGAQHRLSNPSETKPLVIIEVQAGEYLGEDDIVRVEDHYGRHTQRV